MYGLLKQVLVCHVTMLSLFLGGGGGWGIVDGKGQRAIFH